MLFKLVLFSEIAEQLFSLSSEMYRKVIWTICFFVTCECNVVQFYEPEGWCGFFNC